jgi:CMP-N,N'-diacetyllegionaminic acid synthase
VILGVIPARGGSKRVPRKNIRMLNGRPLIAWTIHKAKETCSRVVVSSDDEEILEIAESFGAEVIKRPENLADDVTSADHVAYHAGSLIPHDFLVLLQPTSPFRSVDDIQNCLYISKRHNSPCVSVTPLKVNTCCDIDQKGNLIVMPERHLYRLNGAVYVAPKDQAFFCENTKVHVMPGERSLDIDTEEDLKKANRMLGSVSEDEAYAMACP